ncbi:MAG: hypothetical protein JKY99_11945 [Rhizobiales bacterium]|nr:hypothetical protein [Hyphomicrobiales bacterium]
MIMRRLSAQRWVLIIAAIGFAALVLHGDLAFWTAFLLFLAISIAAILAVPAGIAPTKLALQPALQEPANTSGPDVSTHPLLASLTTASILIDTNTIIQFANDAAQTTFGELKPGEPLAMRIRQPDFIAALTQAANSGESVALEYVDRAPMERWFGIDITHVNFATDQHYLLVQFQDLSQQKRTDRMRVDFVANASHELRTPLASMSGFIETLLGPAKDDEPARLKFLAIMREQSLRMSRLIDDLLSLSRIEMKLHLKPTDNIELGSVIQHVADALTPLATENNVELEISCADHKVSVVGDENELFQVFSNLIENAIKYGSSGKRVEIILAEGTQSSGPKATIRDFGPGIPAEHVPRLTERFYRIDVESSRQKQGTGLGLAIVKHILNRHNAGFEIQSKLGEGASFTVQFPKNPSAN